MASIDPNQLDVFGIYARYCDIVSRNDHGTSRELLNIFSKSLELRRQTGDAILDDLCRLMSSLNLSVDSRQFNWFYDFVFFFLREKGQKNITVSRAISAWRLVLTGRFRLLSQWCNFIEEHQRHNVSEDTWQQLLAFSRCVNEDLEGYDPKGAWPVIIDDFVEHMYRINQTKICSTHDFCCSCGDLETPGISNTFSGLNLLPGSKRKSLVDTDMDSEEKLTSSSYLMNSKRPKYTSVHNADYHVDTNIHNSLGCLQGSPSACAVEDSLSKGFEGHLSIGCCFHFDQKSRVSYT